MDKKTAPGIPGTMLKEPYLGPQTKTAGKELYKSKDIVYNNKNICFCELGVIIPREYGNFH